MQALNALEKINHIAFSFYTAGAFAAASNLDLFNHLRNGPHSHEVIAKKMGVHPDACRRLLVAMQQLGLVDQRNGQFANSELGAFMQDDSPVPMWFSQKDNYFYRLWEYLPDAMREYSPRHEQAWGKPAQELYKAIYTDPEQLRKFFRLLDSYNIPIGVEAANRIDFSNRRCILDLAGGTGSFAGQVVKANPHLKGITLDLPPVKPVCDEMVARAGIADRFSFLVGDMFDRSTYPQDVDVIFLSYILHNWDDSHCIKILTHCRDTLPKGGMLVVSEKVLGADGCGDWWGVMMSLQMLVAFEPGAKERTLDEYRMLLKEAGFGGEELITLQAPRDLLVAYKL
jgi:hypothetical protein